MASRREIIDRQHSVANIRRVTRTMEMIATVKSRQTMNRAVQARPYTHELARLTHALLDAGTALDHPLLKANPETLPTVLLVLASNRGLCGGYNTHIVHLAQEQFESLDAAGRPVQLRLAGKRGITALRHLGHAITHRYADFDDKADYPKIAALANELISLYRRGAIAAVRVVYTRFISAGRQNAEVLDLLPVKRLPERAPEHHTPLAATEYSYTPEPAHLLDALVPMLVRTELHQCFLDAAVSEQMERRRAMKSATDNANQMLDNLRRQANRARQGEITAELLDIIGGVEALKE